MPRLSFVGVVLAAGRGERLGAGVPKGLAALGRRPLVRWSAEALAGHPACAGLVAVAPPGLAGDVEAALDGVGAAVVRVVEGGARRQDSALRGLEAAASIEAGADLVHDAARPAVPPEMLDRLLAALSAGADAAVPGLPPADTVKRVEGDRVVETPPRSMLRSVGTPQALRRPRGLEAFRRRAAGPDLFTDCAAVLEADGADVRVVEGDARAFKITSPADLARAEAVVAGGGVRVGIGWDSHRFAPPGDPRPLVLGGVRLDHPRGLAGHSDADALAHAVADAVLGAARLGDIGAHFPPGDPSWKNADSIDLLRRVAALARRAGWAVANVDAVVVAEEVRIAPLRAAMEANLASALGVGPGAVSVKGKTAERMGALGRGEGIAAEAVALLRSV